MSDRVLRSKLVRLAHARPELRQHLVPLLKQAVPVRGKAQAYIVTQIAKWPTGHSEQLSDVGRGYRGHFKELMSAAQGLAKKGWIKFDGSKVEVTPKATKDLARYKNAAGGRGWNLMGEIVDYDTLMSLHGKLRKEDQQSADLLRKVMGYIGDKLEMDQGFHNALSRLDAIARIGERGIKGGLLRNNIFKAADLLGMKLPSGMFASLDEQNKSV